MPDLEALDNAVRKMDAEERAAKAVAEARSLMILGRDPADSRKLKCDASGVFFATLALRLEPVVEWDSPTMSTDGKKLFYNPDFTLGLTIEQRVAVVAHEVLHNVMHHQSRRGTREAKRWNVAADLAVNGILEEGGYKLPDCGVFAGKGEYKDWPKGLTADDYYDRLSGKGGGQQGGDEDGGDEGQGGGDPGGCGGVRDAGEGSPAAATQSASEWDVATSQAATLARRQGKLSGGLDRMVAEVLTPKADWKEVLREFVSRQAKNDYRWFPPNRRYLHDDLYLPGTRSEELGEVVCAVDTSGSVSAEMLRVFASEMQGIMEGFDADLTILYHDSDVKHVQRWAATDGPLRLEPKGGGGTSHVPVFDWLHENAGEAPCLVCLTDLYTEFPDKAPPVPTLWAVYGNGNPSAPFGQIVRLD